MGSPGVFTVERVLIIMTVLAALAGVVMKGYCRVNGYSYTLDPKNVYMELRF